MTKTEPSQNALSQKLINPYLDLYLALRSQPADLQLAIRKKLIWGYSWAIPSDEAIQILSEYSPLLEIGAGSGYWAWLLRQAGADVLAMDKNPQAPPHWTQVIAGDENQASLHHERTLFLCWPPYEDAMAFDALRAYTGKHVAYIGEMNGRTGDKNFHRHLQENFTLIRETEIPNWPGFRDKLCLFSRRL